MNNDYNSSDTLSNLTNLLQGQTGTNSDVIQKLLQRLRDVGGGGLGSLLAMLFGGPPPGGGGQVGPPGGGGGWIGPPGGGGGGGGGAGLGNELEFGDGYSNGDRLVLLEKA